MPTISHVVEHMIDQRPLLQEAIIEDIVSFGSIAEKIKPQIEKELDKEVKLSAVVMALRRASAKMMKKAPQKRFDVNSDITMKTNISDIGVLKSPNFLSKLKEIYDIVDYEKGDHLNIIHGNHEISIIVHEKYFDRVIGILKGERIVRQQKGLVIVGLNFPLEYMDQPGVIATITRKLAWTGVNILEIVSTYKELNVVIDKKDATKAYNALQELIEGR